MNEVHVQDFADAVAPVTPALEDLAGAAVFFGVRVVVEESPVLGAESQQPGVTFVGGHDHGGACQFGQTLALRRASVDGADQAAKMILL